MNEHFRQHVESLQPSMDRLLSCTPFKFAALPQDLPRAGVYLFTENGEHMNVGRTDNLRQRLQQQCWPSSTHNSAPFAFLLAREQHGVQEATYRPEGSREWLCAQPDFVLKFTNAKARLRSMDIRFVEEAHSLRQALLEMYVAIALPTRYNSFSNH